MSDDASVSLAIVIASCDKYSDLWPTLFGEFFEHWPDCHFPIFLVANHRRYDDPRVTTLLAGDDLDWSTTIARALEGVPQSHILFWIDDAFLSAPVDTCEVARFFDWMVAVEANFLRLRPGPAPEQWLDRDIGILAPDAAYRVSLFATIWRRSLLDEILKPGESAWQFEVEGTKRSQSIDGFFSVRAELFQYLHGVERGIWIRSTAHALQKKGYDIPEGRPIMSRVEALRLRYRVFKTWILHRVPERHRQAVLTGVQRFYRRVGLRG
jgi:hypothetical protein